MSQLSRRDLLASAGRLSLAASVSHMLPTPLLVEALAAQAGLPAGKEKLIVRSVRPPDFETPVGLLDSFITPIEHFYVRCHMPTPAAPDAAAWSLQIDGEVATPITLSLADLRAMPATTVTMTLECAGNGRAFFDPPVAGIQWEKGAVGTARWTGVRMADLLTRAGVRTAGRNVVMTGADRPLGAMPPFVRQVGIEKAMAPDTIVAWEMNGQPLPLLHGFPLRAIVPGWEGAYSVKWLTGLRVIDRDFDGFWVATAYRYPTRRVAPGAAVPPEDMAPLGRLAVKSLITRPLDGAVVPPGPVQVAGFAWAGDTAIARVDISLDGGATWAPATLTGEEARYAWRRFEHTFTATRAESTLILSRATDARGQVQPAVPMWNPSGYLWNAPDGVRIEVRNA
ncbi:MAG: sulfite oxidase [Acidobacteriota bacterium]